MAKLTTRQLKAKEILDYAMKGESYADIADKVGSKAKPEYKRQVIYENLQSKAGQAEMAKVAEVLDYSVTDCIKELQKAYQMAEKQGQANAMTQASLGKAKVKGLLVDKVQDVTPIDLDQTAKAAQVMLDELVELENKLGGRVFNGPKSPEDAPGEPN